MYTYTYIRRETFREIEKETEREREKERDIERASAMVGRYRVSCSVVC